MAEINNKELQNRLMKLVFAINTLGGILADAISQLDKVLKEAKAIVFPKEVQNGHEGLVGTG